MRIQITIAFLMMGLLLLSAGLAGAGTETDARTLRLWKAKCAACHGDDGKGATEQGKKMGIADMTQASWQKEFTDDKIKATITSGVKREKNGKHQEMDPFAGTLRPDQIDAMVAYVRSLAK
jgi:mono/diheme cytochrome c family protein